MIIVISVSNYHYLDATAELLFYQKSTKIAQKRTSIKNKDASKATQRKKIKNFVISTKNQFKFRK